MRLISYFDDDGMLRPGLVQGALVAPIDAPDMRAFIELSPEKRKERVGVPRLEAAALAATMAGRGNADRPGVGPAQHGQDHGGTRRAGLWLPARRRAGFSQAGRGLAVGAMNGCRCQSRVYGESADRTQS